MKTQWLIGTLITLLTAVEAPGVPITEFFNSGSSVGTIPDGGQAVFTGTVSDEPGLTVGELTISLNISGGYNGYLYAYLDAPNGQSVLLMNEPGVSEGNSFGASGAGMNITLQDGVAANGSIQNETSAAVLSGSYNPAGTLADFNGAPVDGNWELFFANEVSGGGDSTLTSWSLNITAVPEPVNGALVVFGLLAAGALAARRVAEKHRGK